MITGKIIMKSATKLSLDQRFSEIAKQTPVNPPRIQQQANVIIPSSRQELFGNRRPAAALSIAQRLKKRSINFRRGGLGNNVNANRPIPAPTRARVFQRLGFGNRRRGGGGNVTGANAYLFGGQSGMGIRLRGQGRIGGTRTFRSRTRGYLNNNAISRLTPGNRNRNNRGRLNRNGNNTNNNNRNLNRPNQTRGRKTFNRGRGRNNTNNNKNNNNKANRNVSKETLDTDLDKYMSQTKIDNDAIEMNTV